MATTHQHSLPEPPICGCNSAFAGSQGNFELEAMGPIVIHNFLYSATILADACEKLRRYYLGGTTFHREQIDQYAAG